MKRIFLIIIFSISLFAEKPNLLLLKSYSDDVNVTNWLMSEKLDGVRAYWDGKELISRNGKVFAPPKWFVENFPPFEIDGELWTKRGDFENIVSIVNDYTPHEGWRDISYQIFEVPHQEGGLMDRLKILRSWLKKSSNRYIEIIPQIPCQGQEHLKETLDKWEESGAEGLVVRDPNSLYVGKRSAKALKVKSFQDDECRVMGYKEGRGKFEGLVGALVCAWKNEKVINIGSGLKLEDRKNPPKIGDEVTFKYSGLTKYGNPRFPIFLRLRERLK